MRRKAKGNPARNAKSQCLGAMASCRAHALRKGCRPFSPAGIMKGSVIHGKRREDLPRPTNIPAHIAGETVRNSSIDEDTPHSEGRMSGVGAHRECHGCGKVTACPSKRFPFHLPKLSPDSKWRVDVDGFSLRPIFCPLRPIPLSIKGVPAPAVPEPFGNATQIWTPPRELTIVPHPFPLKGTS